MSSRKRISNTKIVNEIARNQVTRNQTKSGRYTNKPTGSNGSVNRRKKQPFNILPAEIPTVAEAIGSVEISSVADILLNDAVVVEDTEIDDLDFDPRDDLVERGDVEVVRYKTRVIRGNSPIWLSMYSSEVQINYSIHQDPLYWALTVF